MSGAGPHDFDLACGEGDDRSRLGQLARMALGIIPGDGALRFVENLGLVGSDGRSNLELTVVFIDIVHFSDWALDVGDTAATGMLRHAHGEITDVFHGHGGRVVKRLGDGAMATFLEPAEAIEAVLAVQLALAELDPPGQRPQARAGAHHGLPVRMGRELVGIDVNIAAGVAQVAKADELLVSGTVRDMLEPERFEVKRKLRVLQQGTLRGLDLYAVRHRGGGGSG